MNKLLFVLLITLLPVKLTAQDKPVPLELSAGQIAQNKPAALNLRRDSTWIVVHSKDPQNKVWAISFHNMYPYMQEQFDRRPVQDTAIAGISIERPDMGTLIVEMTRYEVFLLPHDTLHISVEGGELSFRGRSASINRFLQYRLKKEGSVYPVVAGSSRRVDGIRSVDSCYKAFTGYEKKDKEFLYSYLTSIEPLPAWYVNNEIYNYQMLRILNLLGLGLERKINRTELQRYAKNIKKFMNTVDEDFKGRLLYHVLIWDYIAKFYDLKQIKTISDSYQYQASIIRNLLKKDLTRQTYLAFWFSMQFSRTQNLRNWEDYRKLREEMKNEIKDKVIDSVLDDMLAKKKQYLESPAALSKGTAAPLFSLKNEKGQEISSKDLTGRWVYLSLWGTWCQGCRQEMPDKNKLAATYKDNLTVVNICLRSDSTEWQKTITNQQIAGVNLFADRIRGQKIEKDFNLSAYPHHVLISPDGRIYENGTLPPKEIPELLDKLLRKE